MTAQSTETGSTPAYTAPPRTLTTSRIVGLIIGAMTPLAVLVGTIPLGLALGGPSLTLAFIASGVIILFFIVGYVQMVQRISRPGAFYNYIARGLGRPAGVGGAMVAALAYPLGMIGAFAINAALMQAMVFSLTGAQLPWELYLIISVVVVGVISYLGIDLSALVVLVIVAIEVVLVAVLVVGIAAQEGIAVTFPAEVFSFDILNVGIASVAFIFAFLCFQGYEAGALYSPEAKRPERTVPRALYIALFIIVACHVLATWALTGVTGTANQQDVLFSTEGGPEAFVFATVQQYLGMPGLIIFSIGTVLTIFAVQIAITNFMARYINTLAAEDLLPAPLARFNRFSAPSSAIITLLTVTLVVVLGASLIGLDPFTQVSSAAFGIGALCATILMALASASVVAYFLRQPASERHWWKTLIAPIIATVLLSAALIVQITGFSWITGSEETWTAVLPWIVVAVAVFGVGFGFWLKQNRPRTYRDLAAGDTAEEAAALRDARLTETAAIRLAKQNAGR